MKKVFLYISILFVICCKEPIKKDSLLGTWYLYRANDFVAIKFTKDSVFTDYVLFSESGKWDLENNTLYFKDSKSNSTNQFEIRIDTTRQSMTIETKEAWLFEGNQRKADNFLEYFGILKGVELETADSLKTSKFKWRKGFNVYITNKTDYPNISTDLSIGIDNLKQDFEKYKNEQPQEIQEKLALLLFVDKGIDTDYLAEILSQLRLNISNPIFKVYKTDIPDFQMEGIYWNVELVE